MRVPTDADRIVWLAARQAPKAISHWTPDDKAQLHALVGKALPSEIARRLGRAEKQVKAKLNQLGYSIPGDALAPIGISSKGLARRISAGYFTVLDAILSRRLKARKNGKDYFVYWKDARAFERQYRRFQQKRAGALARIGERTISAGQFARLVGLSDTQSRRYLQGRIVRAWRVPLDPAHVEWRVSLADAKRVKKMREAGRFKLLLGKKAFRSIAERESAKVNRLRLARRAGPRDDLSRTLSPIAGCYTVAQVASHVGLSETQVYNHVALGRLAVKRERVLGQARVGVEPEALPAYLEWCRRETKPTGPIHPRRSQIERIRKAGLLPLAEAARRYGIKANMLRSAVHRSGLPHRKIDGMIALKTGDVRRYVQRMRERK